MRDVSNIVEMIIQRIRSGELLPGDYLTQRAIADDYDCGRSVAERILRELTQSGWIEVANGGRRIVADVSAHMLHQAVQLRALLETFAVELLVDIASESLLNRMTLVNDQMLEAGQNGQFDLAVACNHEFHTILIGAVDAGPLMRQMDQLYAIRGFSETVGFRGQNHIEKSYREHAEIIELLRTNDIERLIPAVRLHVIENAEGWFRDL